MYLGMNRKEAVERVVECAEKKEDIVRFLRKKIQFRTQFKDYV